MMPTPIPGGIRARTTKTIRTNSGSTPKYVARPEQTPPMMRSDPRRKTPPVVSPMARQLSHFARGTKRGRAWRALGDSAPLDGSPADQQVIDDADDCQDQQQVDEAAGNV